MSKRIMTAFGATLLLAMVLAWPQPSVQSQAALRFGDPPVTSLNAASGAANGTALVMPGAPGEAYELTWEVDVAGGPPASLQVDLEGSFDAAFTIAHQLDTYATVADTMRHVVNKPVPFVRVRLVSIGAGGGTVTGKVYVRKN